MSVTFSKTLLATVAAITLSAAGAAYAAGAHKGGHDDAKNQEHGHADGMAFGQAGKAAEVDRVIEITMGDNFFEPEKLVVRAGETIRFVVKNEGEFLHEFNIGTAATHAAHQKEMMTMMEHGMLTPTGMDHEMMKMDHGANGKMGHVHDDPNSVLLEPGKSQELIWKFAAATDLEFACNVPGHYEAGMMGDITFSASPDNS